MTSKKDLSSVLYNENVESYSLKNNFLFITVYIPYESL